MEEVSVLVGDGSDVLLQSVQSDLPANHVLHPVSQATQGVRYPVYLQVSRPGDRALTVLPVPKVVLEQSQNVISNA